MAIAIHPHSDPRNHSTHLYLVYLLVQALKFFDGLVADLLVENTMRVAWLFLGAGYSLSWGYNPEDSRTTITILFYTGCTAYYSVL
eukprot:scaffold385116_cov86-Attheya_sp.AAC.1